MKLKEVGVKYSINGDTLIISKTENLKPTYIKTLVFPGFPTDLQQPFTTLLTQATGTSIIEETIYENRFKNTYDLNRMGAITNIISLNKLEIKGPRKLHGTNVIATDLRGGASLLIAALIAEGTTEIENSDVILRGYSDVIKKLENKDLVEVLLETGRTHQIRVHFSYLHHPLVGDELYGTKDECLKLHCFSLTFKHPWKNENIEIVDYPSW